MGMDRAMASMNKAFKRAADRIGGLSPQSNKDKSVQMYESLSPDDFEMISHIYGHDEMMRYVRTMEYRRVGGK